MICVGVDLASADDNTAMALLDWGPGGVRLAGLTHPAADEQIVAAVRALPAGARAGFDCPLGWPEPFVSFLVSHSSAASAPVPPKQELLLRRTDVVARAAVRGATGGVALNPLSVSSDRIAVPAMRMARLERAILAPGEADRSGAGLLVEVYPAAALALWGVTHRGYKGRRAADVRSRMLTDLQDRACGLLDIGGHREELVAVDHAFDALVCALVAGAVARGRLLAGSGPADPAEQRAARVEGWIHLPATDLREILLAG